ncbi:MAG: YaiI/YqxD family protein [Oligoflexus sp.]
MHLWIDADACPRVIRDIVLKASERLQIPITFVANQLQALPKSQFVRFIKVDKGADVADSYIIENARVGDLVVTQDIPLAAELVAAGIHAINPRGELYTEDNVRERLNMRDFMDNMRGAGLTSGGPPPLNDRDKQLFANSLDRLLTKLHRR